MRHLTILSTTLSPLAEKHLPDALLKSATIACHCAAGRLFVEKLLQEC